jgi:hypothetical protein
MKSGPRFTALFVAVTAILFAALVLVQAFGASRLDGSGSASAVLALAIVLVLALALLAAVLIKALHEGRA